MSTTISAPRSTTAGTDGVQDTPIYDELVAEHGEPTDDRSDSPEK